jgi:hypothetical protein
MADGLVSGQAQASKYVAGGADQSFLGCVQSGSKNAFTAHFEFIEQGALRPAALRPLSQDGRNDRKLPHAEREEAATPRL